jgi:hypothetical protein
MEETKRSSKSSKRAKVDQQPTQQQQQQVAVRPEPELVVTPELLMTTFQSNYMQCTQLQKKGVKRGQETSERKVERALLQSRTDWNAALSTLLEKQGRLEDLLRSMGLVCPETLLGVPAQQLDKLERVTFWARTVCVAEEGQVTSSSVREQIQHLLDEVTELKFKVKSKQALVTTLSTEVVAFGTKHQSQLNDCLAGNAPGFELTEVLTQSVYNPVFDHNDVYHFFPDLSSVVQFYEGLPERCIREQCTPPGTTLQKLQDSVKPTVAHLQPGCFIGLMVITNLEDTADGNEAVNYDHMCLSVGEQLSGTSLQPGKKYVTWYVGQYSENNGMGSVGQWTQAMDYMFYALSKCPAGCNTEFMKAVKRGLGFHRPFYTCLLPGTKEVTAETWGTVDTLDWIARSIHFWAHQLNTYAPVGYNLPLNHHFHRTLFTEIPGLVKFPLLWQYKELLTQATQECRTLVADVQRAAGAAHEFLSAMKQEFFSCNFHMVFYQWAPVKERVKELEAVMARSHEGIQRLKLCMSVVESSVEMKLNQVHAWSRLYRLDVVTAVAHYSSQMQALGGDALLLLNSVADFVAHVSVFDMEQCEQDLQGLELCNPEWLGKLFGELKQPVVTGELFFSQFGKLKAKMKRCRTLYHPDKGSSQVSKFYQCQTWCQQMESLGRLYETFFKKVR